MKWKTHIHTARGNWKWWFKLKPHKRKCQLPHRCRIPSSAFVCDKRGLRPFLSVLTLARSFNAFKDFLWRTISLNTRKVNVKFKVMNRINLLKLDLKKEQAVSQSLSCSLQAFWWSLCVYSINYAGIFPDESAILEWNEIKVLIHVLVCFWSHFCAMICPFVAHRRCKVFVSLFSLSVFGLWHGFSCIPRLLWEEWTQKQEELGHPFVYVTRLALDFWPVFVCWTEIQMICWKRETINYVT